MKTGIKLEVLLWFLCAMAPVNLDANEHRIIEESKTGVIDTLSWRTFDGEPLWWCLFMYDEPLGDSVAIWFQPSAPCTLKAIRFWQRTLGINLLVDVYEARYDGHIMSRDSTNAKGWIGYNENGQWVEGWRLGHPPLGRHIWGPFPLTVVPANQDWIEIPTRLIGEPFLDGRPFFVCISVWGVTEGATFIGGEDENSIPYHFFRCFGDSMSAPGRAHKGWYLLSASLWIEAVVSYSANTPPEISGMTIRNDTYGGGPYSVNVHVNDRDMDRPERAGVSSVHLVWEVSGIEDSTRMSDQGHHGEYCAEIPMLEAGDTVRYRVSAMDSAGARSATTWTSFARLAPEHPDADVLLVGYGRYTHDVGYDLWIRSLLDSIGYEYEYWSVYEHKGIDESVSGFGWSTVIPYDWDISKDGILGPFPTREYGMNIWADFLSSGMPSRPANILYITNEYIRRYENENNQPEQEFGPGDFAHDFLGLAWTHCIEDTTWLLSGIEGDPVSGDFSVDPFRLIWRCPLWFEPTVARKPATDIFLSQQDSTTGVSYDGGHFKTVYLPWNEGGLLADDSTSCSSPDFRHLTMNIFKWFGTRTGETEVESDPATSGAGDYGLFQNYPNPFNPKTAISYQLSAIGSRIRTTLRIYNILGQEVATLVDEVQEPGKHAVTWDASDMASGVYFYRVTAGEFTDTKRMVLLR